MAEKVMTKIDEERMYSGDVDPELDRRYEGDAKRLQMTLGCFSVEKWEAGIDNMLTNGCFCPSCLLSFMEDDA
jgi:hypothetical protein